MRSDVENCEMRSEWRQQSSHNPALLDPELTVVTLAYIHVDRITPTTVSSSPLRQTWTDIRGAVSVDYPHLHVCDVEKRSEIPLAQRELSAIDPNYRLSDAAAQSIPLPHSARCDLGPAVFA